MNHSIEEIPDSNSLESHWKSIERSRSVMAKQIRSLADTLSGPRQRQLRSIGRWLGGSQGYDAALERPDVLCFCQTWLDALLDKPNEDSLTESEMIAAVGKGYCKFESSAPSPRNLTPFLYPLSALFTWLLLLTVGSIFILPGFRDLYENFGSVVSLSDEWELPWPTRFVLWVGDWFEANWWWMFIVLVLLSMLLVISMRISQRGQAYSFSWFDRRFSRFRVQVSVWTNHIATLLAAGVDDAESIQIAGRCSDSSRLRISSQDYLRGAQKYLIDPIQYPLINNSLSLKNRAAKIAILEETGRYYRAVEQVVQSWWLSWFSKAIIVLIWFTVFFMAVSLYWPVVSILYGLRWLY